MFLAIIRAMNIRYMYNYYSEACSNFSVGTFVLVYSGNIIAQSGKESQIMILENGGFIIYNEISSSSLDTSIYIFLTYRLKEFEQYLKYNCNTRKIPKVITSMYLQES